MPTPEEAKRTHAVDTLGAVARDLSHPVAVYFRSLLEEGLETDEALYLAADFARKLLDDCNPRG
jgi:predicted DNA-binding protein